MDNKKIKLFFVGALILSTFGIEGLVAVAGESEEAVKAVFQEFEKHWNAKDAKAIAPLFHPEAKIKTSNKIVSRDEYIKILPERFKLLGPATNKDIKVEIKGNKATAEAIWIFTNISSKVKIIYSMILEQSKWLIISQDY
jgi:hypothetical protein